MDYKGLPLDEFQENAIRALDAGKTVIVSAPTGSGKTLIAEYVMEKALRENKRLIYTAPLKAISNQKFRDFSHEYGDKIGLVTGDISINPLAEVVIMTTEIFRNTIFDDPERLDDVGYVVFDEVHYMDNEERGTVWEESIIFAPQHIKFLCLSATIANLNDFSDWIRSVRDCEVKVIREDKRPVPLKISVYEISSGVTRIEDVRTVLPVKRRRGKQANAERQKVIRQKRNPQTHQGDDSQYVIAELKANGQLPCLYFAFARRECESKAEQLAKKNFLEEAESLRAQEIFDSLVQEFGIGRSASRDMRGLIARGIGYHHGGMMPSMKEIVEQLFSRGLIKVLFATETFALGVNMPAAAVVFDSLRKFDGQRRRYLLPGEFHQMAGRAGRRGMDKEGFVYAKVESAFDVAPAIEEVTCGAINPIHSRFDLSYATILHLHEKLGNNIYRANELNFGDFKSSKKERAVRVAQLKHRLELLAKMDYIRKQNLTPKGRFASCLYGYELVLTELYFNGVFNDLSTVGLAALLTAVMFEPKPNCKYKRPGRDLANKTVRRAEHVVEQIIGMERTCKVRRLSKPLQFELTETVREWINNCDFDRLSETTTAYPGDIIRAFRMTIQLCRQCAKAGEADRSFAKSLRKCMDLFNRDEVDAAALLQDDFEL